MYFVNLLLVVTILFQYLVYCTVEASKPRTAHDRTTWSKTGVELLSFNHTWTISSIQYLFRDVESSYFSAKGTAAEDIVWRLRMHMHSQHRILVENNSTGKHGRVTASWKVTLHDLNGTLFDTCPEKLPEYVSRGYASSCAIPRAISAISAGLLENTLVIKFEATIRMKIISESSQIKATNFKSPFCDSNKQRANLVKSDTNLSRTFFSFNEEGTDLVTVPISLLASQSQVLSALIANALETRPVLKIRLNDTDRETMEQVLEYICTLDEGIPQGLERKVYEAATKYAISGLRILSQKALGKLVTLENALEMLREAKEFKAELLEEYITDFLNDQIKIIPQDSWKALLGNMTVSDCKNFTQPPSSLSLARTS